MKFRSWRFVAIGLIALISVLPRMAVAQSAKPSSALFKSDSLTCWHVLPDTESEEARNTWNMERGVLTSMAPVQGTISRSLLVSEQSYRDFELAIEVQPDWGICAGIYVRFNDEHQGFRVAVDYRDRGGVGYVHGIGLGGFTDRSWEILGDYAPGGELLDLIARPRSAMMGPEPLITPETWLNAWKRDAWNEINIRVSGDPVRISTRINGLLVSDFDGASFQDIRYDPLHVSRATGQGGRIALEIQAVEDVETTTRCRWRNLRLRTLPQDHITRNL